MSSIKINFIQFFDKEKSGAVTKLKKHNQLYFGTLVLASYCYYGDNGWNTDFLQNSGFKESKDMTVKRISE